MRHPRARLALATVPVVALLAACGGTQQTLSFPTGESELTLTLDRPGVVETHRPERVVFQLQVR